MVARRYEENKNRPDPISGVKTEIMGLPGRRCCRRRRRSDSNTPSTLRSQRQADDGARGVDINLAQARVRIDQR